MNTEELPTAVQKLAELGDLWEQEQWPDYQAMGLGPEHVPALLQILQNRAHFWDLLNEDEEPQGWLPVHAWRALGQMQTEDAIQPLIESLQEIDDDDNEIIQEEVPTVFALIGPPAVPALVDYLLNPENKIWGRLTAAEGLTQMVQLYPEQRPAVLDALLQVLANYQHNDEMFNALLVSFLTELKAVEAADLVQAAFQAQRVDEGIIGDWQDFQEEVGLLKRRGGHRNGNSAASSSVSQPHQKRKEKKQRKQARQSRRQNRGKKK